MPRQPPTEEQRLLAEEALRLLQSRAFLTCLLDAERAICKDIQKLERTDRVQLQELAAELRVLARLPKVLQARAADLTLDSNRGEKRVMEARLDV